ncbi:MAG: hypothetical protein IPG92_17700 [Flavobacteriales bacterium]|nr:hypothetical protein [Flavobacteriales bacterium]MBP7409244.1 hypothetical protein [Flavobacteriales bacterium]
MKQISLFAAALLAMPVLATDRIVEEFGVSPTYPNINAAVTAAVDGDRIIIKNRAGEIPWIENIGIDKSLEFLSYTNDGYFVVQGTYNIAPANGRVVLINGMRNTAGSIGALAGSSSVRGTRVRVVDSYLVNGTINLASNFFDADIVGCTLVNGSVSLFFGNVVGNDIDCSQVNDEGISVNSTTSGASVDTCAIVGNKVKGRVGYDGIFGSTIGQVLHIRNNYVQHGWMGIEVYEGPENNVANLIWNNTVTAYNGNFTTYGINLANTNPNSIWEIMNNAVTRTWSGECRGINKDSGNQGQINVYFNHISTGISTPVSAGFTFAGSNTIDQAITLNADGTFLADGAAIDGGNPAAPFYDLDLSAGDAGAYGGSYALPNFHPLHTGAARVYMTGHPFNVRQGSTLRVKAVSFDR